MIIRLDVRAAGGVRPQSGCFSMRYRDPCGGNDQTSSRHVSCGFTLIEVVIAAAMAGVAALALYGAIQIGYFMVVAAQQRLDAQSLAFDKTLEIFNTYAFETVTLATNLPPIPVSTNSMLPPNSELWVAIYPNVSTSVPYKWDIEVRVKRSRTWLGGRTVILTNDVRFVVSRYTVARN